MKYLSDGCQHLFTEESEKTFSINKNAGSVLPYLRILFFFSSKNNSAITLKTWINHTHLNCQPPLLQHPKRNAYLSKRKCHKQQIASQEYVFPTNCPANMHSFPTLFRKKNARQYFQILVDLEKIPKALTAEIVLIKSLNIWKNKNKQKLSMTFYSIESIDFT